MSNAVKNAHHQLDVYNVPRTAIELETGDTVHLTLVERIVCLKKNITKGEDRRISFSLRSVSEQGAPAPRNH